LKQTINRYCNYLATLTKHSSNLVATDENSQSTSNSWITENGAFDARFDIHTLTAPSCRGSIQRCNHGGEAATHKSSQSPPIQY